MNDLDQQNVDFEDDEQIQITDLDPEGSPQRRRAKLLLTLFHKSATLPWVRYSLTGLFLFTLFSATFLHFYQPAPATSTPPPTPTALPKQYNVNLNFAQNSFYAQANDGTVTAYESRTGRAIWHNKLPEPTFIRAFGQVLYCYYGTPQHQGRLEARSANDGRLLWWNTVPAPQIFQLGMTLGQQNEQVVQEVIQAYLQLDGDTLYADFFTGTIEAFQASNGHLRWTYHYNQSLSQNTNQPDQFRVPMNEQGGIVEITTPDAVMHILNAGDGQEMFHFPFYDNGYFSQVDRGLLYILPYFGNQTGNLNIQVFRLSDGKQLWSMQSPSGGTGQFIEQDGVVYITTGSALKALRGSDGHTLWTYQADTGQMIVGSPLGTLVGSIPGNLAEMNGMLYLLQSNTQTEDTLLGIRLSDGQRVWSTRITAFGDQASNITPVFDQGMIVLFSGSQLGSGRDDTQRHLLYVLNAGTGRILWNASLPPGSLFFQNGAFYLMQANGQVDAWRESDNRPFWHHQAPTSLGLLWMWNSPENPAILVLSGRDGGMSSYEILSTDDGKLLWRSPVP